MTHVGRAGAWLPSLRAVVRIRTSSLLSITPTTQPSITRAFSSNVSSFSNYTVYTGHSGRSPGRPPSGPPPATHCGRSTRLSSRSPAARVLSSVRRLPRLDKRAVRPESPREPLCAGQLVSTQDAASGNKPPTPEAGVLQADAHIQGAAPRPLKQRMAMCPAVRSWVPLQRTGSRCSNTVHACSQPPCCQLSVSRGVDHHPQCGPSTLWSITQP